MVALVTEETKRKFEGTVIDIETIGNFYSYSDSRRYRGLKPVMLGYITEDGLEIHFIKKEDSLSEMRSEIESLLFQLQRPFYAFNSSFEIGVLSHFLGKEVAFERELNKRRYEKKQKVAKRLGVGSYKDPFYGEGKKFPPAWKRREFDKCIKHNRSCLLKEGDILLERGSREPDPIDLRV